MGGVTVPKGIRQRVQDLEVLLSAALAAPAAASSATTPAATAPAAIFAGPATLSAAIRTT